MQNFHRFQQFSRIFQVGKHFLVRLLRVQSRKESAPRGEFALFVDELYDGKIVLSAYAVVVLAERGGDVHHARAVR